MRRPVPWLLALPTLAALVLLAGRLDPPPAPDLWPDLLSWGLWLSLPLWGVGLLAWLRCGGGDSTAHFTGFWLGSGVGLSLLVYTFQPEVYRDADAILSVLPPVFLALSLGSYALGYAVRRWVSTHGKAAR